MPTNYINSGATHTVFDCFHSNMTLKVV